jgi:hypothetical protein
MPDPQTTKDMPIKDAYALMIVVVLVMALVGMTAINWKMWRDVRREMDTPIYVTFDHGDGTKMTATIRRGDLDEHY